MNKEYSSIYRLEHLDKYREYNKKYRQTEKGKIYQRNYNKKYKQEHKEEQKQYKKEYQKKLVISKKVLTELEKTLQRRINAYEERLKQDIDLTWVMTIRLNSDKDTMALIEELKEKYK